MDNHQDWRVDILHILTMEDTMNNVVATIMDLEDLRQVMKATPEHSMAHLGVLLLHILLRVSTDTHQMPEEILRDGELILPHIHILRLVSTHLEAGQWSIISDRLRLLKMEPSIPEIVPLPDLFLHPLIGVLRARGQMNEWVSRNHQRLPASHQLRQIPEKSLRLLPWDRMTVLGNS